MAGPNRKIDPATDICVMTDILNAKGMDDLKSLSNALVSPQVVEAMLNKAYSFGNGNAHGYYKITAIHKDDITQAFEGEDDQDKAYAIVEKLTPEQMEYFASELADDYCEQLFWESLRAIFRGRFMGKD